MKKSKYRYFFRYLTDGQWIEVSKEKYDKALSLKSLWNVLLFEAKKEKNDHI